MARYFILRKYFGFNPKFPKWYHNRQDKRRRAVEATSFALLEDKKYYVAWAVQARGVAEVKERARCLGSAKQFIEQYMRSTLLDNNQTLLEYAMEMSCEVAVNTTERKHHLSKRNAIKS